LILSLLPRTAAAALVAAAAAPAATPPGPAARPVASLSVTPAHVTLLGRSPQLLAVHNDGAVRVQVSVRPTSFDFDAYGNAEIAPERTPARSADTWLAVQPSGLVLAPGAERRLRVEARPPPRAAAGDHHALILLSANTPGARGITIRTRIGVLVLVRVPGRIVRQVALGRVWVDGGARARRIVVTTINRGNIAERLLSGQLTVALRRAGRVVTLAHGLPRDLLPQTRGVAVVPLRASLRGPFTAVVRVAAQPGFAAGPWAPPLPSARLTLRLRL